MKRHNVLAAYAVTALLMSALLLAACGGSDDGSDGGSSGSDNGLCHTISQSLVTATANTGSTLDDPAAAIDQNFGTFATLTPAVANGGATIRTAAASTQSAGSAAGIDFTTPTAGSFTFTVTTYAGNVQQEAVQLGPQNYALGAGSQNCSTTGNGDCLNNSNGQSFFGLITTKPYDSFSVALSVSASTSPVQLRELCVH
jgi:hypothetical protein